ncbi:hypothetical protein EUX98_g7270 [Antrodiella citrinella]|uniref:Uncharacterized protein n=1 Tax=Antrodiella citrinella TaxID=2447956 RepID=A0A4S4MNN4_9APHY|nr:hypothetical protein EUX98_g7270 [Antrodiella citrinella]
MRTFKIAVVAAGLGLASAQLSGLSSSCQSTLTSIVISPSSTCLNAQALLGVVTTAANSSLVGPINNWLTGMCAQPACSNDTLTTIVHNVTSGCSSDLQSIGAGALNITDAVSIVLSAYPDIREIGCLTDANDNNSLCVTETLTNVQNATGTTLSGSDLVSVLVSILSGQTSKIPPSALCTDCNKAAFNIINSDFPDLSNGSVNVDGNISSVCGADFINGTSPTGISQSAHSGTATAQGAASPAALATPISIAGVFVSSLIALGAGFAVLA